MLMAAQNGPLPFATMLVLLPVSALASMLSAPAASHLGNISPRAPNKLGLLPFLVEHAMMPGETRNVFLFDESLKACVSAAAANQDNYIGGLLVTKDGDAVELAMTPRVRNVIESEDCLFAQLACTGRCRVTSLKKNKKHGFRVALVSPYSDGADGDGADETAVADLGDLRSTHGQVALQRRRLRAELTSSESFDDGYWEGLARAAATKGSKVAPNRTLSAGGIHVGPDKGRRLDDAVRAIKAPGPRVLGGHLEPSLLRVWHRSRS